MTVRLENQEDRGTKQEGEGVPKLLKVVLGETEKLVTLGEFLYDIAKSWPAEAGSLRSGLERAHDHPSYRDLLKTTWCYPGKVVKRLHPGFTLTQYSKQVDVMYRALDALMCSKGGRKNVLCYGHRQEISTARRESAGISSGTGKLLLSPAWEVLLSRIGDTLMLHLMLNVSIFLKMQNQCYFQLSGHPVIDDARFTKKKSDVLLTKFQKKPANSTLPRQDVITQNFASVSPGDGKNIEESHGDGGGGKHTRSKKQRPSSWQRKRYRKALERNGQAALMDVDSKRPSYQGKEYVTQHFGSAGHSSLSAREKESPRRKRDKVYYRYPKKFQTPSEMSFPRSFIFYSTRYGKKCGFNSKHILLRLDPSKNAGKILYQYIFKSWLNPVASKWGHKKPKYLAPIPSRAKVPKRHRYMLPLLARMVKNAKKCQFGALLRVHCPLPVSNVQLKDMDEPAKELDTPEVSTSQTDPRKRPRSASQPPGLTSSRDDDINPRPSKRMTRLGKFLEEAKSQVDRSQRSNGVKGNIPDLGCSFVPHANVAGFVWAVVRHIVPKQLLGGTTAQKYLRRALNKFIGLKRYETMTAHQVLHKIPLSDLPWLQWHHAGKRRGSRPPNSAACKHRLAALWIGWLFSSIVVPTLRNHFYCTENEAYRQQVFYYRKPVWSTMVDRTFNETLSSTFLPIKQQAVKAALEKRKLGVSRLRFLPKRSGLRFLVNMSRSSQARFPAKKRKNKALGTTSCTEEVIKMFNPINATLKYTLNVLQCEAHRQPEAFGSSTYGFNDIYCRYKPFVKQWKSDRVKEISKRAGSMKDVIRDYGPHAVCVDVSRAFDNVDVGTLLSMISSLITSEEYIIFKFTEIITVMGKIQVNFRNIAVPTKEIQGHDVSHYIASLSNGQKDRIFLDCVTTEKITRRTIMKNLEDYLSLNLIKLKRKWRYQSKGIAQGGKPSTLLCSLYLGYIERICFDPLIASCGIQSPSVIASHGSLKENPTSLTAMGMMVSSSGGDASCKTPKDMKRCTQCPQSSHTILIRLVDDWILISRHKAVAEQFATRILQGIPGFNIKVNPSKTQVTFPILDVPGVGYIKQNVHEEADGTKYIKWCGLLVDIQTLELRADYTRYCGEHVGISLNIPVHRNPGTTLSSKLCHYIRPKILPVLLDQEINTPLTIRINVYQIFLLGAMKLHCYVSGLSSPPNKGKSCEWIISAIRTGVRYVVDSTRARRISRLTKGSQTELCNPGLPPCHVEYLGYHAFYTVLKRKQSRYPNLLRELEKEMNEPFRKMCQPHLEEATHPIHSAIFDSIIF